MMSHIVLASALMLYSMSGLAKPEVTYEHFDPSQAIGCLMSHEWVKHDLQELRLRPGNTALVRYRFGPIPQTSPSLPGQLQMIIYSPDRRHARLFLMRVEDGHGYVVTDNAYSLTLSKGEWAAGEGNGGVATYSAIRKYATEVSKQRALRVRLIANSSSCRAQR